MVYIYALVGRLFIYPYLAFKLSRLLPYSLLRVLRWLMGLEFLFALLGLALHRFVMDERMSLAMDINLYIFFSLGYMTAFLMGLNILLWLSERVSGRRLREEMSLRGRACLEWCVAVLTLTVGLGTAYLGYQGGHNIVVHGYHAEGRAESPDLRLVLVTDLHIGEGVRLEHVRKVVREVMNQKPDLILFGGDYIDHDGKYARQPDIMAEMRKLSAPDGVYFVPGNHEYRADSTEKLAWVEELGFTLLVDSIVYPRGGAYSLIGRDDYVHSETRKTLPKILSELKPKPLNILLEHTPEGLDSLSGSPIDYALYGHTHAGQVWPYEHILKLKYDLPYGYGEYGQTKVIVSSGVGAAGTLYRVGTRSEIITLNISGKRDGEGQ